MADSAQRLARVLLFCFLSLALLGGLSLLAASGYLLLINYEQFTHQLLQIAQKQDWKDYFQTAVLPPSRFSLLRYLVPILCLLYWAVVVWSWGRAAAWAGRISGAMKALWASFLTSFRQLSKGEQVALWVLFVLYLARSLFHVHYYAIEYDEAWTYNHFVSKGFFVSAASPNNNHILYSLLAVWTDYLPLPTQYSLRLPALLSGIASFLLCFAVLRKIFSTKMALVGLSFFAFSSSMNFFSFLARGYGWMLFFSLLLTAAFYALLQQKELKHRYLGLYSLTTVLGVYSNPGFLYVWMSSSLLLLLLLIGQVGWKRKVAAFVRWQMGSGLVLLLLHLSLLVTNGFAFLASAATESHRSANFWHYLNRLADWWFWGDGTPLFWLWAVLWILLLLTAGIAWKKWRWSSLIILQLALPFVWWWLMRVQTPFRIWSYELWFWTLALVLIVSAIERWKRWKGGYAYFLAGILALFNGLASERHYFVNWSAKLDREAAQIADLLLTQEEIPTECYTFARYDKPLLEYHFLRNGHVLNCWMPFEESKDYRPFSKRPYEVLLLDVEDYSPTAEDWQFIKQYDYQLLYENDRLKVFITTLY